MASAANPERRANEGLRPAKTQELAEWAMALSTRIGGGRTAPDRAAFFNGALVRDAVRALDTIPVPELTDLLGRVSLG